MKENGFAYMAIYKKIRNNITSGVYKYGDRLPSKRTLADETNTSVITVCHAYEILCDEGYAESRERSGYFVIYKQEDVFPVSDEPPLMVRRGEHSSEELSFSSFSKTVRKVLSERQKELFEKSQNTGLLELRHAICRYLARSRGILVDCENIVIGAGSEYLYGLIVQILGRNKLYALEDPCYEKIEKVYKANGALLEHLKMGAEGILSKELQKSEADVLHITPFNSFPSGITASASKRLEYINWAHKNNAFIIEDDFDSEFSQLAKTEDTVFALEREKRADFGKNSAEFKNSSLNDGRVIYMNTFSKTIAPSIRAGYMVLPDSILEKFKKIAGFYSCTVSVLEQYILADFLESGDFERHINKIRRKRRKNNKNCW